MHSESFLDIDHEFFKELMTYYCMKYTSINNDAKQSMTDKICSTTSASRMKKMREKLKRENPDYQKEENRRISELKKRKRQQMTNEDLEAVRKYERERKRIQRKRKQETDKNSDEPVNLSNACSVGFPYLSPQSFGKAVLRTARSLPKSQKKKNCCQ